MLPTVQITENGKCVSLRVMKIRRLKKFEMEKEMGLLSGSGTSTFWLGFLLFIKEDANFLHADNKD